jgi:hypothetical protein
MVGPKKFKICAGLALSAKQTEINVLHELGLLMSLDRGFNDACSVLLFPEVWTRVV